MTDRNLDNIKKAMEMIKDIAEDLPLNKELEGTVSRVENYGVFVSLPRRKA